MCGNISIPFPFLSLFSVFLDGLMEQMIHGRLKKTPETEQIIFRGRPS